jgi:AraC-like DNA-binding protein
MIRTILLALSVFLVGLNSAIAAESAITRTEIAHLFNALETSSCQFSRNGSWYSAKEAAAHLRTKYKYLQDRDLIPSAEKFIERAATKSSFSGKAYQIKCVGNLPQPSSPWFLMLLTKHRVAVKVN